MRQSATSYLNSRLDEPLTAGVTRRAVSRGFFESISQRVRSLKSFLVWTVPASARFTSLGLSGKRRLLMIYDLSAQPFSIGDILVIQEASLVLREKWHLDVVDFALVYDPERPTCDDLSFSKITSENISYHLASVFPAAQINQHLGSLFIFTPHEQLETFIANNAKSYCVWPTAMEYAKREYLYYTVFNDLLYEYHREHGRIPHLSCREFLIRRAQSFYAENIYPEIPVTVQIRNNKSISPSRNLRMECWIEFFKHCEGRYPVKFIVICGRNEVDERLRDCRNVIIAKDQLTSLEEDLAFISTAALHMGAASGPGTVAIFGAKPYLLVNSTLTPSLYRDMIQEGEFVRFYFASESQRLTLEPETTELLIKEFARMWAAVDVSDWYSAARREGKLEPETLTWLR